MLRHFEWAYQYADEMITLEHASASIDDQAGALSTRLGQTILLSKKDALNEADPRLQNRATLSLRSETGSWCANGGKYYGFVLRQLTRTTAGP
jgi:hypothetical protein